MKAFGPGSKASNGWYVRLWPNPGFAFVRKDGRRHYFRLFTTKPVAGARRFGTRYPTR